MYSFKFRPITMYSVSALHAWSSDHTIGNSPLVLLAMIHKNKDLNVQKSLPAVPSNELIRPRYGCTL